jgi:UDP-N-acetylglucosamine--N-acetylmuramyl-(pentapeptide) pyrophosphoryl-undecaprenol N-acetylglucosamine transferase
VIPGRANKFLAVFADKIMISFEETEKYFANYRRRIVRTGNPLRCGLKKINKTEALEYFGLSPGKVTILVMGGSQGSHAVNLVFLKFISMSPDTSRLQVLHLAGNNDVLEAKKTYEAARIGYRVFSFLDEMEYAYCASDLVISRAGATTISEIMYYGLPSILVPYPYAHKHQMANAEVLTSKHLAVLIEERFLSVEVLKRQIDSLINDPERLRLIREAFGTRVPQDAALSLVQEVEALVRG